jgi:hypothetical protein
MQLKNTERGVHAASMCIVNGGGDAISAAPFGEHLDAA